MTDRPTVPEREVDAAIAAVELAASACRSAQGRLLADQTLTKGDDSPVTVADFAAQAIVATVLARELGTFALVGEETVEDLRGRERATLLRGVVGLVRDALGDRVTADDVLDAIGAGASDGHDDRFWTLDPIDGTKGFVRGDQYAIALARIEHGKVTLGVLGCPNLPDPKHRDRPPGATFVATADACDVITASGRRAARVAEPASLSQARMCESVEPGHTDQGRSARVAALLGITAPPYRIDSQCKYGAVARGDASIYLRLPTRPGYREKIWDHAAGMYVVERAGGRVTDVTGAPLDFGHGSRLETNLGVVATDGRFHDEIVDAVQQVLEPTT